MRTFARLIAAAATSSAVLLFAGGGPGAAASRPQSRLLVYAQEWHLFASRTTVPAGRISVELWNRGQDAHNLHIRGLGGGGRARLSSVTAPGIPTTASGSLGDASWTLGPGRYELYCSLPQHRLLGMHATIVVR